MAFKMIEQYLEDITQAVWGIRVRPGTVSNLNKNIFF